ncbi:MAG: DUF4242 domain-containing protein [Sphingomonas sp.]|nr:DUF4242 domain-containing protein [Sphingomonas sp.]
MKDYLIERHIPGADALTPDQLRDAAAHSNAVLAQLGPGIKWVDSVIVKDGTVCHYQAENEDLIREHARISGFPANKITEIKGGLSPASASA